MANDATLVAMCALLAIAAAADVACRRIPNAVAVALAVLGIVVGASQGVAGWASAMAALLVTGTIMIAAWRKRVLGGGDVKLAAAAAACVGLARLPDFLLATAVIGGAVALLTVAAAAVHRIRTQAPLLRPRVPYGVAIALGAASVVVGQ